MLAEVAKQTDEVATKNTFIAALWDQLKEAEEAVGSLFIYGNQIVVKITIISYK